MCVCVCLKDKRKTTFQVPASIILATSIDVLCPPEPCGIVDTCDLLHMGSHKKERKESLMIIATKLMFMRQGAHGVALTRMVSGQSSSNLVGFNQEAVLPVGSCPKVDLPHPVSKERKARESIVCLSYKPSHLHASNFTIAVLRTGKGGGGGGGIHNTFTETKGIPLLGKCQCTLFPVGRRGSA